MSAKWNPKNERNDGSRYPLLESSSLELVYPRKARTSSLEDMVKCPTRKQNLEFIQPHFENHYICIILPKRTERYIALFRDACSQYTQITQLSATGIVDPLQHVVWKYESASFESLVSAVAQLIVGLPQAEIPPPCVGRTAEKKISYRLLIPSRFAYRIIGVRGQTIQFMREKLRCDIFISQTYCKDNRILCLVSSSNTEHFSVCSGLRVVAMAHSIMWGTPTGISKIWNDARSVLDPVEHSVLQMISKSREEQQESTPIQPPAETPRYAPVLQTQMSNTSSRVPSIEINTPLRSSRSFVNFPLNIPGIEERSSQINHPMGSSFWSSDSFVMAPDHMGDVRVPMAFRSHEYLTRGSMSMDFNYSPPLNTTSSMSCTPVYPLNPVERAEDSTNSYLSPN